MLRNKTKKSPSDYFDEWGTLDKLNGDGGDSCAYFYTFYALHAMGAHVESARIHSIYGGRHQIPSASHFLITSKSHHVSDGVLVRHPAPHRDASDWDRMSRDQMIPALIAWGFLSPKELWKFFKGHITRGLLFAANTRRNGATKRNHSKMEAGEVRDYSWKLPDLTTFGTWAVYIRAFKAWYLWPLLLLFDVNNMFSAMIIRYSNKNIVLNHALELLQAKHRLPTPWSWLALKINGIEDLATRIEDHLDDFPDHIVWIGDMYRNAARGPVLTAK